MPKFVKLSEIQRREMLRDKGYQIIEETTDVWVNLDHIIVIQPCDASLYEEKGCRTFLGMVDVEEGTSTGLFIRETIEEIFNAEKREL